MLVTRDESHGNYGSTYWPSPQSSWCAAVGGCWPPPAAIDSGPYTGGIDAANSIQLTSGRASLDGIAGSAITVTKQFTPVPGSGAIDVTYTLTNVVGATVSVSLAPWQVSRVAAGRAHVLRPGERPADVRARHRSHLHADPGGRRSLVRLGARHARLEGVRRRHRLARARHAGAAALPRRPIRTSSRPTPPPARRRSRSSRNGDYVELEAQGALAAIAPGEALTWTVRWKLRRVPGGTTVAAGSTALASLAAAALAE